MKIEFIKKTTINGKTFQAGDLLEVDSELGNKLIKKKSVKTWQAQA